MSYSLALVTGASSGIGLALCELLADKGIHLIITGRDLSRLENNAKFLRTKVSVQIIQADLAKPAERTKLIELIRQRVPDLVVNNAGFGLYNSAVDYPTQKQMEILDVNASAMLELTLEASKALKNANKKGVILNVSSAAAFFIFPYFSVYAASKRFVNDVSQSLDYELRDDGIRVLTICPGMVDTNFRLRSGGKPVEDKSGLMTADYVAKEIWQQIQSLSPLRIINWKYRLAVMARQFIPKYLSTLILKKNIKKRCQ